jgi:HD-like signal output (HDOD) protein
MSENSLVQRTADAPNILKVAERLGLLRRSAGHAPAIMAALCNPQTTAGQLATLIESEAALCARVLRVANSPYYGYSRSISSISRALILLGLDAVRGIAAAACLQHSLPRSRDKPLIDTQALMNHSVATAAAAQSLARIARPDRASEAFISGLLHNLGTVVQLQVDVPGVKAILDRRMLGDSRDIVELEADHAEIPHAECAAIIYEAWKLPDSMIEAARHHHSPAAAVGQSHQDLAALINLGATVALAAGWTFALEPHAGTRNRQAMALLGLDDPQIDAAAEQLPAQVTLLTSELRQA